ncbi:hypothetical protein [Sporosarcina sp. USHLN248]|uniref:hypothetical protein n=1 Tax=Sporosarcina sp. USHLN248 TaxID=3081300 RepID=UPI00301A57CF
MTNKYLKYAERLHSIGDLIVEISNLIQIGSIESVRATEEKFDYAIASVKDVKPPEEVNKEHNELVNALRMWNLGNKQANGMKSEHIVINAQAAMLKYQSVIEGITDRIVQKLKPLVQN